MAEVRIGTDYQIADCQNIAQMIIDPEGKGLQDFWMKAGWEWMSAAILHVLYRVRHESGGTRTACLRSEERRGGKDGSVRLVPGGSGISKKKKKNRQRRT